MPDTVIPGDTALSRFTITGYGDDRAEAEPFAPTERDGSCSCCCGVCGDISGLSIFTFSVGDRGEFKGVDGEEDEEA